MNRSVFSLLIFLCFFSNPVSGSKLHKFHAITNDQSLSASMVKDIVKDDAGKIWFESTVGQGSTFYVQLPAAN